jgi:lysozyme
LTAVDIALPRLRQEEGFRATLYIDTEGHKTIGYGLNIDAGISQRVAAAALEAQLEELQETLAKYPWYALLDPVRQSVLLDIAFNNGLSGLLHFPHMLAAISRQDWSTASTECHVENPELAGRYQKLAQLLLIGGTQ